MFLHPGAPRSVFNAAMFSVCLCFKSVFLAWREPAHPHHHHTPTQPAEEPFGGDLIPHEYE